MGRPARKPEEPFRAHHARPFAPDKLPETLWMKRPARTINEMRDAVFLGLGRVFATQFLEPTGRLGRFIEVEEMVLSTLSRPSFPNSAISILARGFSPFRIVI